MSWRVAVVMVLLMVVQGFAGEHPDRGLVALKCDDGSVFLSWRLLQTDAKDAAFQVVRKSDGQEKILTQSTKATCYVDASPGSGTAMYELHDQTAGTLATISVDLNADAQPYLSIPLQGDYNFQQVGIADLDGDGAYEYVIKQPRFNTDPYQKEGYWKRSPMTYKIEAYRANGDMMWQYDMGWAIEAGIWYSPWLVYDVDGDGRAEVYCKAGEGDPREEAGHVMKGPEYLVKLDGETGKIVAQTDWLPREGYRDYNLSSRNFLTVAYLDGRTPSLVMQRGTYRLIRMRALDKDFHVIWQWESTQETQKYGGQSSHGLVTADVDGDGRDELVMGAAVIDDNGKGLWSLEMGHPDVCYVADIDPDNPGLEVFYGFESRQETDGICLVDAKTGRKLWAHKEPTRHIHNQGMAADVLAEYPGMEVYVGERDLKARWLYSAKGELIAFREEGSLSPRAVWWDADPQKEINGRREITDWGGDTLQKIEGRVVAVGDCLGDYREEVITSLSGELRIYSTTIPAADRRVHLMQDRQYRLGVAAQTMGYYYPAQLGE